MGHVQILNPITSKFLELHGEGGDIMRLLVFLQVHEALRVEHLKWDLLFNWNSFWSFWSDYVQDSVFNDKRNILSVYLLRELDALLESLAYLFLELLSCRLILNWKRIQNLSIQRLRLDISYLYFLLFWILNFRLRLLYFCWWKIKHYGKW